jgi:RNA polymerase sigma-70 factor (ECF subfamily)
MDTVLRAWHSKGRSRVRTTRSAREFTDFYEATWDELAGYAASVSGSATLGADLAQEAFARVFARWALLRDPRPYAYRIVTNLAKDTWRAGHREQAALALLDAVPRPTGHDEGLLDAVRRLPPKLRDVVLLHYYADLPVNDVATVLRRPAGTVKSQLFDARAALAANLKDAR